MKKTLCLFAVLLVGTALFAQQKYALVIGNSNYTGISSLRNPVNDANDMETALRALGFNVEKVLNGDLDRMENAVANLGRRLGASGDSIGFFFYAGHGVQAGGVNYLLPVSAGNIQSETHLRQRAVSLDFIMETLGNAGNSLNMIVLDACRDNPFTWGRSGSRGLTVVSSPPAGSIVMFAAGSGQVADDGGTGRNGVFTGHLLASLNAPGLSVYEVFDRTMGSVMRATANRQTPELRILYPGASAVFLGSRPQAAPQPSPQPAPQADPVSEFIRAVRRTTPENALIGIGSSSHSNHRLAISAAESRARLEIARQVEAVVTSMISDYAAGSEAAPQALRQFTESVTRTLAQQTQRGAVIADFNRINGEQIVIVTLPIESLRDGLMSASQSAAALAPHMGSAQWALERMNDALAMQNRLEPVVRRND